MEFKFPDVGEGIHKGRIVKWHVKEGELVKEDDVLAEVETDKAVVEIPSPTYGKVLKMHAKEGEEIEVGSVMVTFKVAENVKVAENSQEKKTDVSKEVSRKEESAKEESKKSGGVVGFIEYKDEGLPIKKRTEVKSPVKKIKATPAVRKYAKDKGIDLFKLRGTGPGGRITYNDVDRGEEAAEKKKETASESEREKADGYTEKKSGGIKVTRKYDMYGFIERIPYTGLRKAIARHTKEAWNNAVHVTIMGEANADSLVEHKEREKKNAEEKGIKLTFMPFIVKAVVNALQEFPQMNSEIHQEEIIVKKYFNIGIAVDTGKGLYVPVIKRAEQKTVTDIAQEISELAEKAISEKLDAMDMKGGSFTITNLGTLGVKFFTPIINYPQTSILGIGRIYKKPVVKNDEIVVGNVLPLSLVFDHRAVDGLYASRFLERLIKHLQDIDSVLIQ